jgi:hypothetical protein
MRRMDASFKNARALRLRFSQSLARRRQTKNRPLIGTVSNQLRKEWKPTEQRRQQCSAAIAILNAGGMNDGVQQQTQRIDENMSLLALDQFARIEPVRIDADPPFSALFTL